MLATSSILTLVLVAGATGAAIRSPQQVVRLFYQHIAASKPLGIPRGEVRAVLWPLMSARLAKLLETVDACEQDYFRQHPEENVKPIFWWLEHGLFSGGNEHALPAEVAIERTEKIGHEKFRVHVLFTYRETFATYGRPPNPENEFRWRGAVIVVCEAGRCSFDDFVEASDDGRSSSLLSKQFSDCDGPKWVGERR